MSFVKGTSTPGRPRSHKIAIAFGSTVGCICLLVLTGGILFWLRQRRNRQILDNVDGQSENTLECRDDCCNYFLICANTDAMLLFLELN